ncbi:hypothetical protein NECAME_07158 [Necator americanus]|uniref:Uncharacterized protein n=1 Tax=Necator americanus TaxID=51031 RepID=W2TRX2_NECAM|nr:hypothetical protein NECAME_07158 [Necator americanus]ETN83866.1 hypothetical protein NECAME_07158 [Necator americanus]
MAPSSEIRMTTPNCLEKQHGVKMPLPTDTAIAKESMERRKKSTMEQLLSEEHCFNLQTTQ